MFPRNFEEAVNTGFAPYMEETMKSEKINDVIETFKYIVSIGDDPNDYIDATLAKHGLTEDMLTDAECRKIMRAINEY